MDPENYYQNDGSGQEESINDPYIGEDLENMPDNFQRHNRERRMNPQNTNVYIDQRKRMAQWSYINNRIFFPYRPYDIQIGIMQYVVDCLDNKSHGLIQSPTGTGKTISLLCSVLGWLLEDGKRKSYGTISKVIYVSRSHSQLAQIRKEIKQTCYRPKTSIVGSRSKLCANPQVSQIQDNEEKNDACFEKMKLRKIYDRARLNPNLYRMTEQELRDMEEKLCSYEKPFEERKQIYKNILQRLHSNGQTFDLTTQKNMCEAEQVCPFYYPSTANYYSDFLVMPYNYLLNRRIFERYSKFTQNSVIIFDEAHNILQAAADGMSIQVTKSFYFKALQDLGIMEQKIKQEQKKAKKRLELDEEPIPQNQELDVNGDEREFINLRQENRPNQNKDEKNLPEMRRHLEYLKEKLMIFDQVLKEYLRIRAQKYIQKYEQTQLQSDQKATEHCQNIPLQLLKMFVNPNCILEGPAIEVELRKLLTELQLIRTTILRFFTLCSGFKYEPFYLNRLSQYILQIAETFNPEIGDTEHYGMFLKFENIHKHRENEQKQNKGSGQKTDNKKFRQKIRFQCYKSSLMLQKINSTNPRSIIITSGTLSPLESWSSSTGLNFYQNGKSFNDVHVINPIQTMTVNVCQHKRRNLYMKAGQDIIANAKKGVEVVKEICQYVPKGVLVILPSGSWMKEFKRILQEPQNRRFPKKLIFEDKQQVRNLRQFIQNYRAMCNSEEGAVLFAISRGQLTEGINFKDELCRAVVIVGVPEKPRNDLELNCAKDYHDKQHEKDLNNLTGSQWSNEEMFRTINQGIGRVIRHADDFGIIFLVDMRYQQGYQYHEKNLHNQLAGWAKKKFNSVDSSKISFYTNHFFSVMRGRGRIP